MSRSAKAAAVLISFWMPASAAAPQETSTLWGTAGERWSPAGRLPDFSFAGYHSGKDPLPILPVKGSVKEFGAVGDGKSDDTAAFEKAISRVNGGALWIPKGRYRITRVLHVDKSDFVLRGEGPKKSILCFPLSLTEAVGSGKAHAPGGSWSWSGGFLSFQGGNQESFLAAVSAPARRGDYALSVSSSSAAALSAGKMIRLWQYDHDGSLGRTLYAGKGSSPAEFKNRKLIDFSSRIKAVEGGRVILERPLRVEVRLEWKPVLYSDEPTVTEAGVEDLGIEFPAESYAGHHQEPGYNAIQFAQVENGWIRNLIVTNADSGIIFRDETKFCTVQGVRFRTTHGRTRKGYGDDPHESVTDKVVGHHGILIANSSQDNLITDFRFDDCFIHDLGVSSCAAGNVFCAGRGRDLTLDHHRRAPYENLFTDLNAGKGKRYWGKGGDESDGPPAGARETFWNIRASRPQTLPAWGLETTVVGITTQELSRIPPDGNWFEAIPPERLQPADLYLGQREARKARP